MVAPARRAAGHTAAEPVALYSAAVMRPWVALAMVLATSSAAAQPTSSNLTLVPLIPNGLTQPVGIVHAGDGSNRLFIVEQPGKIRIWKDGAVLAAPFLDLSGKIQDCSTTCGGERGLLGLAFHPDYENNGFFYVLYTRKDDAATPGIDETGDLLVARYHVSADPDLADASSALRLLTIDHSSQGNHNGGNIAFKPTSSDPYLYIGTGDGGGGGDPFENGQNVNTLLGKLLRIDVDGAVAVPADPDHNYTIPAGNPFAGSPGADEVWDFGLRNPWRWSFDRTTGQLYIGDVGQGAYEEIDFEAADSAGGLDFGWDCREGAHDYDDPNGDFNAGCAGVLSVDPVLEYTHSLGCSVTGGFVYRGDTSAGGSSAFISGNFIFGDFCSGRIWRGFKTGPATWASQELFDTAYGISTFGEDEIGKLYLADRAGGAIYRIAPYSFLDVPPDAKSWTPIESVYLDGVSLGCGGGRYCGDDPVQRQQIAPLLVRAQDPQAAPSSCAGEPYSDVAAASEYCKWIKALKDQSITSSCDGGNAFCPTQPVTRAGLAFLLWNTVHVGETPSPPSCSKDVYEVPKSDPLCPWIRDAAAEGLVPACNETANRFCRDAPVRRDQLAALLASAFSGTTIPPATP